MTGNYRAYLIGHDGLIFRAVEMPRENDTKAIEAAKLLVDGHDVELWERARLVAVFKRKADGGQ